MQQTELEQYRYFLKDSIRKNIDFSRTDQCRGIPPPPIVKPYREDQQVIPMIPVTEIADRYPLTLQSAIERRQSRRRFGKEPLSMTELSFLLWATQGIKQVIDNGHALRTVPSAGARHALETYLAVINVDGLETGFYRYLPLGHSLLLEKPDEKVGQTIKEVTFNQGWMASASVVFLWSAIPYRMEWRYGLAAHRVILLDTGHVCQNLYLACEAVNAGVCAVAAYDQERMDLLLGLDGDDEFVIYTAAVGKMT